MLSLLFGLGSLIFGLGAPSIFELSHQNLMVEISRII
jgi:hypothetical protein